MFVTWASDRPGGFIDDDLAALQRIQRRLAIACKTVIQSQISRNIAEAYLGRQTGQRVLAGSIRLGDGEQTRALVWYSDLRSSTRLAETMPSEDFLELLNVYFECSARPAIAAGGEVLAFVGDAVLAIFPVADDKELPELTRRVTDALNKSLVLTDRINDERITNGTEPIRYGIGLNIGSVMYGNIGVPERLAFSAIGPTVIEVARIEKLTKTIGSRVLATRQVAAIEPRLWRSVGLHRLEGVGQPQELFGYQEEAAQEAA
jgi:adenylate cyclase